MSKYRIPSDIPKQDYLAAIHWCLRYPLWKAEIELIPDTSKAIEYDKDHVQTSNDFDPVSTLAIRRVEISRKMTLLEDTIRRYVEEPMFKFMLLGIGYGYKEIQLSELEMPCGKKYYYDRRRKILKDIAQKI